VKHTQFIEHEVLKELSHYLPAQAPLKDFVHHNTLHAFQHLPFQKATLQATEMFGYKTLLSLEEYRSLFATGRISSTVLDKIVASRMGKAVVGIWKRKLLHDDYPAPKPPRIGALRSRWKKDYRVDLSSLVHPFLFRILCSYLDQGISMWGFPVWHKGFLTSIREIERTSVTSFFKSKRAQHYLLDHYSLTSLLREVVGNERYFKQYLFDQQFAHQGWSGMVAVIENDPQSLLDRKKISLHDLIVFELLLEIDALDSHFKEGWEPLGYHAGEKPVDLFEEVSAPEYHQVLMLWQEAFEWTYYDEVLQGVKQGFNGKQDSSAKTFQAMFCLDDRACSIRRYLERIDTGCETLGTPGFFNVEFFYKPEHGKFLTKLCPAPVTPRYLIKEKGTKGKHERDVHFAKHSHGLFRGWLISQTLGFWSALRLFINIFRPSMSPATATSLRHMDKHSTLTIECKHPGHREKDLQVGFTIPEMADRVEGLLKSIGLVKNFAPLVYVVGHGSSSVNNPYYAAYDCGACSGRPGSVNARVVCHMANHAGVRELLSTRGIDIPSTTRFVGALHDTTRDEVVFFDEETLSAELTEAHACNASVFHTALELNAKERSRRFEMVDSKRTLNIVHEAVRRRSVSLFEPRPEYNHATNASCIIGRRNLTRHVFLDRRSFLNSYDYRIDPEGKYLLNILNAAAPVCGGINLEYFFSRVDNQKLGAGTKLPHNVMGLFGVANGIDGDLRPGLPSQMIEIHDPVRLLTLVEHKPDVVLKVIQSSPPAYEWFENEWIHLVVVDPDTHAFWIFRDGLFVPYDPVENVILRADDLMPVLEARSENLPVYLIP
jgi:uncharacterized protein YbcC (UPF0753/DUF2309 family)